MGIRTPDPRRTPSTGSRDAVSRRGDAPAVELIRVSVVRAGRRVLDDVDLEISRGETVAILGAPGAGKSTTLEICLAVQPVDSGGVRVLGLEPAVAVASGRVGAVLSDHPPSGARVGELLRFFRAVHDAPLPVDDLVDRAGLGPVLDRSTDQLSRSQTQRLRFALALAGDPDIVVLDEPGEGLDPEGLEALATNLRRLRMEGRTVLLATRDGEVAASSADRVVLIEGGRFIGEADPDVTRRRLAAHDTVVDRRATWPPRSVAAPGRHE